MMPSMAFQIAGIAVPGPGQLLDTARSVAGWGARAAGTVAALPDRAEALLAGADRLIVRIDAVARRAEELIERVDAVAWSAERTVAAAGAMATDAVGVVRRAGQVTDAASAVVGPAGEVSRRAAELLGPLESLSRDALPLAGRFVAELSESEVVAAVQLVDELPRLAEHLRSDIMPILATLDRVGPDLNELLEVVKDVRAAVAGLPGLGYLRRRAPAEPET